MFLPVTPHGQVPVTAAGEPVLVEKVPGGVGKHAVVDRYPAGVRVSGRRC